MVNCAPQLPQLLHQASFLLRCPLVVHAVEVALLAQSTPLLCGSCGHATRSLDLRVQRGDLLGERRVVHVRVGHVRSRGGGRQRARGLALIPAARAECVA